MEPEGWVGQQVSVYLDTRGSMGNKAIGVLELVDDTGVVIEEDEDVIAFYPWRFILAIKVGEPEEPTQRKRSIRGRRQREIEGPEEKPRSGPTGPSGPSRRPEGPSGPSRRPTGPSGPSRRPTGPSGPSGGPTGPSGPSRRPQGPSRAKAQTPRPPRTRKALREHRPAYCQQRHHLAKGDFWGHSAMDTRCDPVGVQLLSNRVNPPAS